MKTITTDKAKELIRETNGKIFSSTFIKKDNTIEIAKNNTKQNLSTIFDLIHFNLGPIAIAIKNGIKNGIINL